MVLLVVWEGETSTHDQRHHRRQQWTDFVWPDHRGIFHQVIVFLWETGSTEDYKEVLNPDLCCPNLSSIE